MFKKICLGAAIAALLSHTLNASAASDADLQAIRAQIEQLKQHYEQRIAKLDQRLQQAEGRASQAPAAAASPTSGGAFQPEVSLILQGRYRNAEGEGHISGFLPAGHAHGAGKGFSPDESELILGASIDPYFRGQANFALAGDTIETEEAWVQTSALGNGFTAKLGRYLSGIGYINEQHPHAWDFAEQNLAYTAMLGQHYIQDGVQLKWVAPTPVFLEFGVEAGQGADWSERNSLGSHALFAHVGDDLGDSHAWRAGLSYLRSKANGRGGHWDDDADVEAETEFSGTSKYWIADFVWKWAPGGNPAYENFKLQAEYVQRDESGDLACADNTADGGACAGLTDTYRARQSGWYAQGVYQFHPQWRAGYRYDRLNAGSIDFGAGYAGIFSQPGHTPDRHSLMLDYNPSEFSRLRLQLAQDRGEAGLADKQFTLQYLHSLGTHGAHKF